MFLLSSRPLGRYWLSGFWWGFWAGVGVMTVAVTAGAVTWLLMTS